MANLKSSQKDIRRIARRAERNRAVLSRLKTLRKKVVTEGSSAEDSTLYTSALDKAVKKGVIHRNRANREKSKVARSVLHPKVK